MIRAVLKRLATFLQLADAIQGVFQFRGWHGRAGVINEECQVVLEVEGKADQRRPGTGRMTRSEEPMGG
jgi:hypothetical protein